MKILITSAYFASFIEHAPKHGVAILETVGDQITISDNENSGNLIALCDEIGCEIRWSAVAVVPKPSRTVDLGVTMKSVLTGGGAVGGG